jgi:hypothetical protein
VSEERWQMDDNEDPFGALDAALGEREPRAPQWSIEAGNANDPDGSPEAQGRRAAKLTARVKRARDVQAMQFAMIDAEIEDLEAQLAEAKHRRVQVDRWFLDRTQFERGQLRWWHDTAEMFQDSRQKTFPLSHGFELAARKVPERVKWEAPVDALLPVLPDECFDYKTSVRKAEANKLVEVRDGQVILRETGEVVEGATVETTPGYTDVYLTWGAGTARIPLAAELDAIKEVAGDDE